VPPLVCRGFLDSRLLLKVDFYHLLLAGHPSGKFLILEGFFVLLLKTNLYELFFEFYDFLMIPKKV